jgi:hypothetical protein
MPFTFLSAIPRCEEIAMQNRDPNAAQKARMDEREKELQAELKTLQEQRRVLNEGDQGGHTPTQPGSASRTSAGEPGKYDNPGQTGHGDQPRAQNQPNQPNQPNQQPRPTQPQNPNQPQNPAPNQPNR